MKILAIGEIIFDIFGDDAVIGGAPLNFCAHCVASGADVALISGVGDDEFGRKAIGHLEEFGVDSRFVSTVPAQTGKCIVTVANGRPSYNVMRPAAYDMLEADTKLIADYAADVFAFGTLIQRESRSREAVRRVLAECDFREVFCDINLRRDCYDKESCLLCLENATILKLSDEEEPLLAEFGFYETAENEEKLLENIAGAFSNIRLILFTKGENGSLIYDARSGEITVVPAETAEVVSTVGAGDSYGAAFLCEYLRSGDTAKAGEAGAKLSAFVVSHKEAIPTL